MSGEPHFDSAELAGLEPAGGIDPVERLQARKRAHAALFGESVGSSPPIRVDRYELISKAGAGGLGTVWKAYDPKLDREIAIKLLRSDKLRAGQRARRQLMAEAKVMARLAHPNVVRVYDVGEADVDLGLSGIGAPGSGKTGMQLYVAMEFVDGCTLRHWQRDSKRSVAELVAVYSEAAAGLIAAHEAELVHGDFKPDNVLIDGRGRVLVTDFAVTRNIVRDRVEYELSTLESPTESERNNKVRESIAAVMIGTPAYMAPEQLDGEVPDARSDQFALCVALWEAIVGERPFPGRSFAALREAIAAGPPSFPAGVGSTRLRNVLARGLAEDPKSRYPSLRELLEELRPAAATSKPRARAWALGVAALVTAVGLAIVVPQLRETEPPVQAGVAAPLESCAAEVERVGAQVWTPEQVAALERNWDPSTDHGEVEARLAAWHERWRNAAEAACEAARARPEHADQAPTMACLERQLERFGVAVAQLTTVDVDARAHVDDALASLPTIASCDDPRRAARIAGEVFADAEQREALTDARTSLERTEYLLLLHEYDDVLSLIEPVLSLSESLDWDAGVARASLVRGAARIALGQVEAGCEDLSEAMLAARRAGRPDIEAEPLIELALVAIDNADFAAAKRWIELAAIAVTVEVEDDRQRVGLALARGLLAVAEADDASARVEFARTLRLAKLDDEGSELDPKDPAQVRALLERLRDANALNPAARRRVTAKLEQTGSAPPAN